MRIDVNNVPNYPYYKVPADNPFINISGARPEIWAYGFRNPWGLEFGNNYLVITDAGYETGTGQEEVNIVVKGGNYGWNLKEGNRIAPWTKIDISDIRQSLIDSIFSYTTGDKAFADSDVSTIIGGYYDVGGDYICADYSGRLIRLRFEKTGVKVVETAIVGKWIRSFGKVRDKLYLLTSQVQGPNGTTGEVHELTVV